MRFLMAAVLTAGCVVRCVQGRDESIAIGNVPDSIIAAAKAQFQVSKFLSAEKRTIDKKLIHYALEIKLKNKTTMDAYFSTDAKLIRTGVSVKPEDVPVVVRDAFQKEYGDWTVTELNKETDADSKAEYYNVEINKNGKTLELDFTPDGKIAKTLELKETD